MCHYVSNYIFILPYVFTSSTETLVFFVLILFHDHIVIVVEVGTVKMIFICQKKINTEDRINNDTDGLKIFEKQNIFQENIL